MNPRAHRCWWCFNSVWFITATFVCLKYRNIYIYIFSTPYSSPEVSSSDAGEDTELPTTFHQSQISFISTSHSGPVCTNICQSASSARCHRQKPSSSSTALNSLAGGSSRSVPNVESKIYPQWHECKTSGEIQRGRNLSPDDSRSLSGRSHVRSKVSWVWDNVCCKLKLLLTLVSSLN